MSWLEDSTCGMLWADVAEAILLSPEGLSEEVRMEEMRGFCMRIAPGCLGRVGLTIIGEVDVDSDQDVVVVVAVPDSERPKGVDEACGTNTSIVVVASGSRELIIVVVDVTEP